VVSQDCRAPESFHSAVSCGTTADAENQTDMASSAARASSETFRRLPRSPGRRGTRGVVELIRGEGITGGATARQAPPVKDWSDYDGYLAGAPLLGSSAGLT
jgi:hypothetical protein